ncbi:hypothetical protein BOX15_Mlig016695g1 [Macrostomum lignano]|uniref:Peroxisomal membrane protein 11B n=1 Tax=Macrostomum lignano TaxID=282301 RepID=A0A267FRX6_9PLAT|nr:hypothetical protein BOX15_Mlig016695g1 [Macrostomum lignano]
MEKVLILIRQTAFRDKLFRLVQYASRLLAHLLEVKRLGGLDGLRARQELIVKLTRLELHLSTARKLLRLGNSADSIYAALRSLHIKNDVHRFTITMSRIASAIFLLIDHWLWVGRVGLAQVDKTKWSSISNRFWLLSILLGLTRDAYDITNYCQASGGLSRALRDRPLLLDTAKNICDLFLPVVSLNYVRLSPGAQGFFGLISSALALAVIAKPSLKLIP